MIAKTIFSLIITIMLGLTITAVYADTPTYHYRRWVSADQKDSATLKGKGTCQFNCTTDPKYPYKGTITLFGHFGQEYPLKSGGNVSFNLQEEKHSPGNLILHFKGSKDLQLTDKCGKRGGIFQCTYKKIK